MKMNRRRTITGIGCLAVVAIAVAAVVFLRRDRTPDPPNVTAMGLRDAMEFEGSDAYTKLSDAKRRAFSEAVIGKLQALPFEGMLRIALDPANMDMQRRRLANLRKLRDYDELHSRLAADFLEKFYKLSAFKRSVYLTAFAYYQEMESRIDPARYKTPEPGEFHTDAVKLFSKQSPKMKAYAMQFMIDLRGQRQKLGLKDLPIPMK
jgi:hypothetical protein